MEIPAVRRELPLLLELSGLCGLAIALPVLDLLGHSPDFLVLERLDAGDLVFLAAVVALVPPLALEAAGAVAGLAGPLARRAAHLATVAGLLAALSVQVGKHLTPLRGLPLAVAAALAARRSMAEDTAIARGLAAAARETSAARTDVLIATRAQRRGVELLKERWTAERDAERERDAVREADEIATARFTHHHGAPRPGLRPKEPS